MRPTLSFGALGQAVSEEKICLGIGQSKTRIACGGLICNRIETKWTLFIENLT